MAYNREKQARINAAVHAANEAGNISVREFSRIQTVWSLIAREADPERITEAFVTLLSERGECKGDSVVIEPASTLRVIHAVMKAEEEN